MPLALAVNREEARMLVATLGYEEAAKQSGIKRNTLIQWAKRFHWHVKPVHAQSAVTTVIAQPAQALQNVLAENSHRTKLGFSKAALKVAESVAEAAPEQIMKDSQAIRHMAHVGSMVGGWEEKKGDSGLHLHMLSLGPTQINIGTPESNEQ